MLFTDSAFLFYFLPACLLLIWILNKFQQGPGFGGASRCALFLMTLGFYGFREPVWLIPFFVCIGFDFLWSTCLFRTKNPTLRLGFLMLSVVQNVALLAAFKYWEFIRETLIAVVPSAKAVLPVLMRNEKPFPLPAGISFYTFESLSFVFDVYRGLIPGPVPFRDFFPFIGMFPRLVAGPIVRFREIVPQLNHYQGMKIESGLAVFALGLFLKCCFADHFAVFAGYAFGRSPAAIDVTAAWLGGFSYTMQIYFDFSGYSLMAIGLGRCLGFEFPTNFNRPFLSVSMRDFWARWHISFTTWIRDYFFNPLALSALRRSRFLFFGVLALTIVLSGLWHGAKWTYAVFGLWNGALLILEFRYSYSKKLPPALRRPFTFLQVLVGFVIFRANDLPEALHVLRSMFLPTHGPLAFNVTTLLSHPLSVLFCVLGIFYCFWFERVVEVSRIERMLADNWFQKVVAAVLMACSIVTSLAAQNIPFLYYQF